MLVLLSLLDLFHVIDVSKLKSILRFLCLLSSAVRKRWAFSLFLEDSIATFRLGLTRGHPSTIVNPATTGSVSH